MPTFDRPSTLFYLTGPASGDRLKSPNALELTMTQLNSLDPGQAISGPASLLPVIEHKRVNWPHVWAYLGLAFGLSWLLDLLMYLAGGLKNPAAGLLLQFQMLLPAFSALLLGMFFFQESPVYYKTNRTASRWFVYYYFFMVAAYLVVAVLGLLQPGRELAYLAAVRAGPVSLLCVGNAAELCL